MYTFVTFDSSNAVYSYTLELEGGPYDIDIDVGTFTCMAKSKNNRNYISKQQQ